MMAFLPEGRRWCACCRTTGISWCARPRATTRSRPSSLSCGAPPNTSLSSCPQRVFLGTNPCLFVFLPWNLSVPTCDPHCQRKTPNHFCFFFRFEGPAFETIQELILHQFQSGASVTSRSGAILRTPVLR